MRASTTKPRRSGTSGRGRSLLGGALLLVAASCAPAAPAPGPAPVVTSTSRQAHEAPTVAFSWIDLDGRPLDNEALAGRVTVIGFIATYDIASQAQARFIARVFREHTPRLNAALLVLEQRESEPMARAFASALDLTFPVALSDAATIRGEGPFKGLHHVPSLVILDREGRERFRHLGLLDYPELDAMIRRVEADSGVGAAAPSDSQIP